MSNHRRSHLVPSFERFEPRLTPSGGGGTPQSIIDSLQGAQLSDTFALMQLFHQMAMEQRATARESRELAREAQHEAIQAQVEKMREAAQFALAKGIISGAMQIGSGAISIGGGAKGLKSASGAKSLDAGHLAHKELTAGKKVQPGGLGQMIGQIGQIERSALHAMGDARQAGQKELEAEARQASLDGQSRADLMQQMQATMEQMREKLAQIANAQQEAMGTILRA